MFRTKTVFIPENGCLSMGFSFREIASMIWLPAAVFIIHVLLIVSNAYYWFEWIDSPMHFLGGVTLGLTFSTLLFLLQKKNYLGNAHPIVLFFLVIGLAAFAGVVWEFLEFAGGALFSFLGQQPSVADTMKDLFLDLAGAVVGFLIFQRRKKK